MVNIDMSPKDDLFLSASSKNFEIYDLNTKKCIARLDVGESVGNILCKFDPYGLIFVVVYPVISEGKYKNIIQVFDAREVSRGAFALWNIEGAEAISIDFSLDGQYLIMNTKTNQIFVIDAIEGKIKNVFKEYIGNGICPVVFSPDSKYFFTGCEKSSSILVVGTDNCQKIHDIRGCEKSIKSIA